MINKVVTPIVGAFFSVLTGFAVLTALVYFGHGGGAAGQSAVQATTQQAMGLAVAVIGAVVQLGQAIIGAVMGAVQAR